MFDYQEAEANYWYKKYKSLQAKTPYAVSFNMADQEIVTYTEEEWDDFLTKVQEEYLDGEEFDTVADMLEFWSGDEFFWKYV
jgi:hypothetical protein